MTKIKSKIFFADLPNVVHDTGQGLRVGDTSFVSLTELVNIINQKYSFVDANYRSVKTVAHEIVKADTPLHFCKRFRARTHRKQVYNKINYGIYRNWPKNR